MEDQIKTNIGKIFTKYNKDTDSFDMIRIVHNNDENIFYRKPRRYDGYNRGNCFKSSYESFGNN